MRDPADDGPEVRIIRREQVVQFVDWVEINVGEAKRAKKRNRFVAAFGRWMLGVRTPRIFRA
jgi:hypothetical protein